MDNRYHVLSMPVRCAAAGRFWAEGWNIDVSGPRESPALRFGFLSDFF